MKIRLGICAWAVVGALIPGKYGQRVERIQMWGGESPEGLSAAFKRTL